MTPTKARKKLDSTKHEAPEYRERLSALEAKHDNLVGLVEEVARSFSSLSDDLRNYTRESEARQVAAQEADRRRITRLEAQSGTNWQTLFGAAGIAITLGGIISYPHIQDIDELRLDTKRTFAEHDRRMDTISERALILETESRVRLNGAAAAQANVTAGDLRSIIDQLNRERGRESDR